MNPCKNDDSDNELIDVVTVTDAVPLPLPPPYQHSHIVRAPPIQQVHPQQQQQPQQQPQLHPSPHFNYFLQAHMTPPSRDMTPQTPVPSWSSGSNSNASSNPNSVKPSEAKTDKVTFVTYKFVI